MIFESGTVLLENQALIIRHLPAWSAVHLYWKNRDQESEIKTGLLFAMDFVKAVKPEIWINDISLVGYGKVGNGRWLIDDFLTNLIQLGVQKMVAVVPDDAVSVLVSKNMANIMQQKFGRKQNFEMRYFTSADDAYSWLQIVTQNQ